MALQDLCTYPATDWMEYNLYIDSMHSYVNQFLQSQNIKIHATYNRDNMVFEMFDFHLAWILDFFRSYDSDHMEHASIRVERKDTTTIYTVSNNFSIWDILLFLSTSSRPSTDCVEIANQWMKNNPSENPYPQSALSNQQLTNYRSDRQFMNTFFEEMNEDPQECKYKYALSVDDIRCLLHNTSD